MSAVRAHWAVWPCDHGDVQREPGPVPAHHRCAECGAEPINLVPLTDYRQAVGIIETAHQELRDALRRSDQVLREYAEDAVEAMDAFLAARGTRS